MGIQSQIYLADGTTRTYVATKPIVNKAHVRVFLQDVENGSWVVKLQGTYELVNNSIVFNEAYSGFQIEVRVADTEDELEDSPSDITIVAGLATELITVAGMDTEIIDVASEPLKTSVLNAQANADTTDANVILSNADVVSTNNNVALTNADVVTTNTNVGLTNADVVLTHADVVLTNADVITSQGYAQDASDSADRAEQYDPETYRATQPTLTGLTTVVESADLVLTISNYEASATYTATTSSGTVAIVGDTITITAGSVTADEPHTLEIYNESHFYLRSIVTTYNFTVTKVVEQVANYVINPIGAGWNDTNFPEVVGGYLDNRLIASAEDFVSNGVLIGSFDTQAEVDEFTPDTSNILTLLTNSMLIDRNGGDGLGAYITIPVVNGVEYEFTYNLDAVASGGELDVRAGTTLGGVDAIPYAPTTVLGAKSHTFTAPGALLYFNFGVANDTNGTVTISNISLKRTDGIYLGCVATALQYDKIDNPTYTWSGTVGTTDYVESELVNRLASADATDILVNNQVSNGDVLYIGDGTSEAELVASSVVDNLNGTFTLPHNQLTWIPTYTCSQDNVSVPISFDDGVNYTVADKVSGTLVQYNSPSDTTGVTALYEMNGSASDTTGTYHGDATDVDFTQDGVIGKCATFNGSSSIVTLGTTIDEIGTNDFTIAFWAKHSSIASQTIIFHYGRSADPGSLAIGTYCIDEGSINITGVLGDATASTDWVTANTKNDDNTYHHYVLLRNGVTLVMYVDGISVDSATVSSVSITSTQQAKIGCGEGSGGYGYWYAGSIDQVKIYPTAISLAQIEADYKVGMVQYREYLDTMVADVNGSELIYRVEAKEDGTEVLEANIGLMEVV